MTGKPSGKDSIQGKRRRSRIAKDASDRKSQRRSNQDPEIMDESGSIEDDDNSNKKNILTAICCVVTIAVVFPILGLIMVYNSGSGGM